MTKEHRKQLIRILKQKGACYGINCSDCYFYTFLTSGCEPFNSSSNDMIEEVNRNLNSEKLKLI